VNPDRRESDLQPVTEDVQQLWSGSSTGGAAQTDDGMPVVVKYQSTSLWWYVMLLALALVIAESALASGYMGTRREEI
jgi:hypothetical protein